MPGVAYPFLEGDNGEGVPIGLLRARTALVINTSNTAAEREQLAFGDPLEAIWKRCVFGLCGVTDVHRETFSVVVTSTPEQREEWLSRCARRSVDCPGTPPEREERAHTAWRTDRLLAVLFAAAS